MTENQINLAPQDQLNTSLWGKFLTWSLSAGRFIVVFTELIVISAFLSRFFFDNQLRTLNSSIEQKVAIIASNSNFETNFRELQNRLTLAASLTDSQLPTQNFLADIENLLPQTVYISQLSIRDGKISLQGIALSENSLTQLLRNLKTHPRLSNINLGQLTTETEQTAQAQGIKFVINANWQTQNAATPNSGKPPSNPNTNPIP